MRSLSFSTPRRMRLAALLMGGMGVLSVMSPSRASVFKRGTGLSIFQEWEGIGPVKRYNVICRDAHIVTENPQDAEDDSLNVGEILVYEPKNESVIGVQFEYKPRYKTQMDILVVYDPDKQLDLNNVDNDYVVLKLSNVLKRSVQETDLIGLLRGKKLSVFTSWFKEDKLSILWKDPKTGTYNLKARFVPVPTVGDSISQTGNFNPPPPNYTPPPCP